eukprot:14403764-Ditylum_brightwellii.AAC.1
MLMDIVNMYPSCKLKLIKHAFCYYGQNLQPKEKSTIKKFIEMIAFGMKSTLIRYKDEYFNYKGVVGENKNDTNKDENGLLIGLYEAAFCADVGTTYVYEMNKKILDKLRFSGAYRDDRLTIFNEHLSLRQVIHWFRQFQLRVNKLVGGDFFQFTAEVWSPATTDNPPDLLETINEILPKEEWKKWKKKVKLVEKSVSLLGHATIMEEKQPLLLSLPQEEPNDKVRQQRELPLDSSI